MIAYPPKYRGKQEYLLVHAELINAAWKRVPRPPTDQPAAGSDDRGLQGLSA